MKTVAKTQSIYVTCHSPPDEYIPDALDQTLSQFDLLNFIPIIFVLKLCSKIQDNIISLRTNFSLVYP